MPRPTGVDASFFKSWSPNMAYVLGVVCADGCLVEHGNGYHCLNITSKDYSWLEQIKHALKAQQRIGTKRHAYQLQIRNQTLYRSLLELGLTPRKSKTLQLPSVPSDVFPDFVRGYLDGDGTVLVWQDPRWQHPWQMRVAFSCGNRLFLEKLRLQLQQVAGLSPGSLLTRPEVSVLSYTIADSLKLYHWMYRDAGCLCLVRKRERFEKFLALKKRKANGHAAGFANTRQGVTVDVAGRLR